MSEYTPEQVEAMAVGSKLPASCLACGHVGERTITHAELPDIYVCRTCVDRIAHDGVVLLRECYEWLFESKSDGPRVSEGAIEKGWYSPEFLALHEKLANAVVQGDVSSRGTLPDKDGQP